jgi:hypothetical protein
MASDRLAAGFGRVVLATALLGVAPLGTQAHAAPPAASCSTDDSVSLTGSNLWDGLVGKTIMLTMHDGSRRSGLVVGQSSEALVFARAGDGELISIDKREVADVHLRGREIAGLEKDGHGRRIAGVMLLTLGSAGALTGTIWLAADPSAVYGHLPLLLAAGALAGGGAGLLKFGKRRKAEYERSWGIARVRVMPSLVLGREGGQVGLTLRFR